MEKSEKKTFKMASAFGATNERKLLYLSEKFCDSAVLFKLDNWFSNWNIHVNTDAGSIPENSGKYADIISMNPAKTTPN